MLISRALLFAVTYEQFHQEDLVENHLHSHLEEMENVSEFDIDIL